MLPLPRLTHDGLHVGNLGRGGRPLVPSHAPDSHRRVTENIGDVDGHRFVVLAEYIRHRQPIGRHWRVPIEGRSPARCSGAILLILEGRMGNAINAHQLGGYALAYFRVVVRFAQNGQPGVGVQVDKTGANHVPGSVNDARGVESQVGVVAAMHRTVSPETATAA